MSLSRRRSRVHAVDSGAQARPSMADIASHEENEWTRVARGRRRALLVGACVLAAYALFGFATRSTRTGSLAMASVQVLWAVVLALLGFALPACSPRTGGALARVAAVISAAAQTTIVHVRGGVAGTGYPWLVALPMAGVVLFEDDLVTALVLAGSVLAGGIVEALVTRQPPAQIVMVAMQLSAAGLLAVAASLSHRRRRAEERAASRARAEADALRRQAEHNERELRARDDFLAIVAHELRTPLTPLGLVADELARFVERPDRLTVEVVAPRVDRLRRTVHRLGALIQQLVDLNRAMGGPLTQRAERLDLAESIRTVVERLADDARRAGSELRLVAPSRLEGRWDVYLVELALTNVISNALKYGAGKPVEVTLRDRDGTASISVRDHGIGIAGEDRERIFRRFERAVPTTHYAGLGIGLWIAREAALAHGGDIEIESEIGRGSTFTLTFESARASVLSDSRGESSPRA